MDSEHSGESGAAEMVGSVMVVGAGICGLQAALDLAESGFRVYLVEESPEIGGHMLELDKTFPTNDCGMCQILPRFAGGDRDEGFCLRTVFAHPNIEILTCTEVQDAEGGPGRFTVSLSRHTDPQRCSDLGDPQNMGPVPLRRAFGEDRKDPREVCREEKVEVGALVLAPGYDAFDASLKREYGYGVYDNVVTGLEFERMLNASGSSKGHLLRPSDGEEPKRIAFIQCVGSRDLSCDQGYCSSVCCMYTAKEAMLAKEHLETVETIVFCSDVRAFGKGFESYYERARDEYGVRYVRCMISKVFELQRTRNLRTTYLTEDGAVKEEEFDLVVLSVGLRPSESGRRLSERLGLDTNEYGFPRTDPFDPVASSRPGIFVCGAFREPMDVPEAVVEASAAASAAAQLLVAARGTLVRPKEYPPERDIEDEEPRIGVFICSCGDEIGGVVDVPTLTGRIRRTKDVVWAEDFPDMCSRETLERIGARIEEHRLNRVVVGACTLRTHGALFRDVVRDAGLNRHLLEMANIRDQCSWVHRDEPERATQKADDLLSMAIARGRLLRPVRTRSLELTRSGLILGGGLAGLAASLSLAGQGFEVHLVEREDELGGALRHFHYTLDGSDPQALLRDLIARAEAEERIHIYLNAEIEHLSGYVGNYHARVVCPDENGERGPIDLQPGAILVATGGREYRPTEYLYGQHERVITQRELEERLVETERERRRGGQGDKGTRRQDDGRGQTLLVSPSPCLPIGEVRSGGVVVMIQCVGSRDQEHPYCSRICCSQAIKNALKIKELSPDTKVFVLYRDIRTYGFREEYYRKARDAGVVFVQYDTEREPSVRAEGDRVRVEVVDPILNTRLALDADLLVLSAGVVSGENEALAQMLGVPLTSNGFFLEAHPKFRPLDFSADGIFLCGLAHSPRDLSETIAQAQAAAIRAATILSKDHIESGAIVAVVKEKWCVGCGVCVQVCPYDARSLDEERRVAVVEEVLCRGCGACIVACPSGASQQQGFEGKGIFSMIEAAAG